MLDNLVETVQKLKDRIRDHKPYYAEGRNAEWRTRIGLIDPLLHALGWDVTDPKVVEIEPRVSATTESGEGWADYALLGHLGRPSLIIEAKNLSVKKPPIPQTVGYVFSENSKRPDKITYCAWTNGDDWAIYDVFKNEPVLELSLSAGDSAKTALSFLGLWRVSMTESGFNSPLEPFVLADPFPPPTPPVPPPPEDPKGWTPLTEVGAPKGATAPQQMRLPDGKVKQLRNWRSVLLETALYLHGLGTLTRSNCTYQIGRSRYLFSTEGVHPTGVAFKSKVPLGETGIIMEGNLSAADLVRHTAQLMERFEHHPEGVLLKF